MTERFGSRVRCPASSAHWDLGPSAQPIGIWDHLLSPLGSGTICSAHWDLGPSAQPTGIWDHFPSTYPQCDPWCGHCDVESHRHWQSFGRPTPPLSACPTLSHASSGWLFRFRPISGHLAPRVQLSILLTAGCGVRRRAVDGTARPVVAHR